MANILLLHAEQRNSNEKNIELNTSAIIRDIKSRNTSLPTNILQLFKGLPNEDDEKDYADKLIEIDNENDFEHPIQLPLNNINSESKTEANEDTVQPESYSQTPFFNINNSNSNRNNNNNNSNSNSNSNSNINQEIETDIESETENEPQNEPLSLNQNVDMKEAIEVENIKRVYEIHDSFVQFAPYGPWIAPPPKAYILEKVKFLKKSIGLEINVLTKNKG